MTNDHLDTQLAALRRVFDTLDSVAVAVSGGVDSTLVLKIAHDVLGARAVAVTAVSASLATGELEEAQRLAAQIGARHVALRTQETSDPRYLANPVNRCYFCKTDIFDAMQRFAAREHIATIVDGLNADDFRDHRPGRQAAREHKVLSPLAQVGMSKDDIRALSKALGLPTWDKPALACLSSRIPYGTTITLEALSEIDRAENYLRSFGVRQVRVRHFSDTARIEVEPRDIAIVRDHRARDARGTRRTRAFGRGTAQPAQWVSRSVDVDLQPMSFSARRAGEPSNEIRQLPSAKPASQVEAARNLSARDRFANVNFGE